MKISPLEIPGLALIELQPFMDQRGSFCARYDEAVFRRHGIEAHFINDSLSRSVPGVLRGLHFQYDPMQGKLVSVVRGRIWDVTVDIRAGSSTFGKWIGVELSEKNQKMLWIPPGFAHGFCVLGDETADVYYKIEGDYNPAGDSGIYWADPELGIPWPNKNPILSAKDQKLQSFADYRRKVGA